MTTPAKLISSIGAGVGSGVGAAAVAAASASVSASTAVAGGCVGATPTGSGSVQAKAARATSRPPSQTTASLGFLERLPHAPHPRKRRYRPVLPDFVEFESHSNETPPDLRAAGARHSSRPWPGRSSGADV